MNKIHVINEVKLGGVKIRVVSTVHLRSKNLIEDRRNNGQ